MHTSIMVKRLAFLLLWASAAFGQQPVQVVVQPQHDPQVSYTIPLAPTKGGAIGMVCFFGAQPVVTDTQGNLFTQVNTDFNGVWLTQSSKVGSPESIIVTFPIPAYLKCPAIFETPLPSAVGAVIPPRTPTHAPQSLQYQDGTATPCSFTLTTTTPNNFVFGYGDSDNFPIGSAAQVTPEAGWTIMGFTPSWMVQYTVQAAPGPITSCFTQPALPDGIYAVEGIVALVPLAPTVPSVTLAINAGSIAIYEDGSVIFPGTLLLSQQQIPGVTVPAGSIASDTYGNLSGSVTANPNFADGNGNLTFFFALPVLPNMTIPYTVPASEFSHGSTGLTLQLILFKAGSGWDVKSQTIALTP